MTKVAWGNAMLDLAKSEVHADWMLERYKNQMRAIFSKGGNQYDLDCREIFRRFAVMVTLYQLDEGFLKDFEWNPDLEAEEYLDFKAAIKKQTKKKGTQ